MAGEAGDGLTAITEYARTKPDIVLMDITMPQMEGIEAVERIVQEHPDARVVMVSSVGYQENILAALQKGRAPFRSKAREARSSLRNRAICSERRGRCRHRPACSMGERDENGSDSAFYWISRRRARRDDEGPGCHRGHDDGGGRISAEGSRGRRRLQGPDRRPDHSGYGTAGGGENCGIHGGRGRGSLPSPSSQKRSASWPTWLSETRSLS